MQFIKSVALGACMASVAAAAVTADQMVSNIDAITELSSDTNNIARSVSLTNFFSTAPQLVNNFRQIVQIAADDVTAMNSNSKRSLAIEKRQECLNVTDIEKCIEDLMEILEDPSEILGGKRRRRRQVTVTNYDPTQQQAICNAFRGFVTVHQQLLATVIGKHGLLSLTPFTQPIAAVLRVLEGGVDTLAFGIINSVPTCAQDATQNKQALDQSLNDAVNEYSD